MADEPRRSEKSAHARGGRDERAATEALAQDASKVQAAGADAAKAASDSVVSLTKRQAENGAELVSQVAGDAARAQSDAAKTFGAAARSASDEAAEVVAKTAEDAAKVAGSVADTGRAAAETGRDMLQSGMSLAAGWQKQFSGFAAGEKFIGTTARVVEIYQGASEHTSANARALAGTYAQLSRGMQSLQKTYVELLERASRRAASRPLEFLKCRSAEDFARVQRDMYVDSLNYSLEATGTLLEAANAIGQDALKSLQERSQRPA